jgi:hypothetical protein
MGHLGHPPRDSGFADTELVGYRPDAAAIGGHQPGAGAPILVDSKAGNDRGAAPATYRLDLPERGWGIAPPNVSCHITGNPRESCGAQGHGEGIQ